MLYSLQLISATVCALQLAPVIARGIGPAGVALSTDCRLYSILVHPHYYNMWSGCAAGAGQGGGHLSRGLLLVHILEKPLDTTLFI